MKTAACREMGDLLEMSAYGLLDDPAFAGDRARLAAHLQACDACAEALAAEREVTESLSAMGRVRVSVSLEDRVMAGVREEAARQTRAARLDRRQKTVLGGAALLGVAAEIAAWAAVVLTVVQFPALRALMPTWSTAEGFARPVLLATANGLEVGAILLRAALTVLRALALLLPSPGVLAVAFVVLVSFTTFVAVRRDLRRAPAPARGLR